MRMVQAGLLMLGAVREGLERQKRLAAKRSNSFRLGNYLKIYKTAAIRMGERWYSRDFLWHRIDRSW